MDRPDKLQIARDVIRENIDVVAVIFIDSDTEAYQSLKDEIQSNINVIDIDQQEKDLRGGE